MDSNGDRITPCECNGDEKLTHNGVFWCERHQCRKTPHWHMLCKTRYDYFQLWQSGYGPGQAQTAPESAPPIRQPMELGDAVERALTAVGITKERVSAWLGRPCRCGERRERLNDLSRWAKHVLLGNHSSAVTELHAIVKCDDAITINCDTHGFGDCMTATWIAEGAKSSGYKLSLNASGEKAKLLAMLGYSPNGVATDAIQLGLRQTFTHDQLRLRDLSVSRLQSWLECLGLQWIEPKRPTCTVSDVAHDAVSDLVAERMVLLFPQSVRANREWPPVYWCELAERLRHDGHTVYILCNHSTRFEKEQGYLAGLSWERIAALMAQSVLVVGNDSAPVHLSGLLDVPTIAVLGPTTANVFAHLPSVSGVSATPDVMQCVGCWFNPPKFAHDPCRNGCAALSNVSVDAVYQQAMEVVR